jgi:hypothetical protein
MMNQEEVLKSALTRVPAPPDLWPRIQSARRPKTHRRIWVPALAAFAIAALALFLHFRNTEMAMDIQPYLQQTPDFVKTVHGESVRHVVMNDVNLFIASPKVNLRVGDERWIDGKVGGIECKRLNCPRVRGVQFSCSNQICVAACRRCSEATLMALMTTLHR